MTIFLLCILFSIFLQFLKVDFLFHSFPLLPRANFNISLSFSLFEEIKPLSSIYVVGRNQKIP